MALHRVADRAEFRACARYRPVRNRRWLLRVLMNRDDLSDGRLFAVFARIEQAQMARAPRPRWFASRPSEEAELVRGTEFGTQIRAQADALRAQADMQRAEIEQVRDRSCGLRDAIGDRSGPSSRGHLSETRKRVMVRRRCR